jgi:site-specific recombinase XerD
VPRWHHSTRRRRFSDRHVFVSRNNTTLTQTAVYDVLVRYCRKAGIPTQTTDAEGQPLVQVDVHSLRRTFATDVIVYGTDPNRVQELLGHRTLAMTRQAVATLSYGHGATTHRHILEYPVGAEKSVPSGHESVTSLVAQS